MERSIQLFGDGKGYEIGDGEAVSVIDTEGSTDKLIEEYSDIYAFLAHETGLELSE